MRVMIAVPIFSPSRQLQRAEPPYVLAGIDALGKARFEMEQAIYEGLHVQAVHQTNRAYPEQSRPPK